MFGIYFLGMFPLILDLAKLIVLQHAREQLES
jgi:hypothetical protein